MKSINELRDMLGQTMRNVVDGKITTDQAKRIAELGTVVCDTVRLEIDLARATDGDFKGTGFIDVDPAPINRKALAGRA